MNRSARNDSIEPIRCSACDGFGAAKHDARPGAALAVVVCVAALGPEFLDECSNPTWQQAMGIVKKLKQERNALAALLAEVEAPGVLIDGNVFVNYDLKDRIRAALKDRAAPRIEALDTVRPQRSLHPSPDRTEEPMNRSARNKVIKALLKKAGFTIEEVADMPLGSVLVNMHRHLCGMRLADAGNCIQLGVSCESLAAAEAGAVVGTISMAHAASLKHAQNGNAYVWLLGPGAKYVARGYVFNLGQFVREVEAWQNAYNAKKESSRA